MLKNKIDLTSQKKRYDKFGLFDMTESLAV